MTLNPAQEALVKKLEGIVQTPEFQKSIRESIIKGQKELAGNECAYRPTRAMIQEPFTI